jgi:ParB-like chromosome segregation protein Spo0J
MPTTTMTHPDPAELTPHPKNSRRHASAQITELRGSLRQFGVVAPIIVNEERVVLAGHGILEAALAEGLPTVPALVVEGLTDLEQRAYLVADNRLAEKSRWDPVLLAAELRQIAPSVDLGDLGFRSWNPEVGLDGFSVRQGEITEDDLATDHLCPCCGFEF